MLRRRLEDIAQRSHEGIDAAAQVLEIDKQHVEAVHHLGRRPADLAVEAEYRDTVGRVGEIRGLDHVVLLVAAQAVLGPEGGCQLDAAGARQGVEAVGQLRGDRRRMGQQGDTPARQWRTQGRIREKTIDAPFHDACSFPGECSVSLIRVPRKLPGW